MEIRYENSKEDLQNANAEYGVVIFKIASNIYVTHGRLKNLISNNLSKLKLNKHCNTKLQYNYNNIYMYKEPILCVEYYVLTDTDIQAHGYAAELIRQLRKTNTFNVCNTRAKSIITNPYSYKLSAGDVVDIRFMYYKLYRNVEDIADKYNISVSHCNNIIKYRRWANIPRFVCKCTKNVY